MQPEKPDSERSPEEPTIVLAAQGDDEPTVVLARQRHDDQRAILAAQRSEDPRAVMPKQAKADSTAVLAAQEKRDTRSQAQPPQPQDPPNVVTTEAESPPGPAPKSQAAEQPKSTASRFKPVLAVLATVATLSLGYLGVAVNAHWYPWQIPPVHMPPPVPTISRNFNRGVTSDSAWQREVINFSNTLSKDHGKILRVKIWFTAAGKYDIWKHRKIDTVGQILYVKGGSEYDRIGMVEIGYNWNTKQGVVGFILELHFMHGPGYDLRYDSSGAFTVYINGWYQISGEYGGAGLANFDLIPMQPPK